MARRESRRPAILDDLLNLRNIEAYAAVAVGILLIAIDIIGEVPDEIKLSAIVAALVILIGRSIPPRVTRPDLDAVLKDRSQFVRTRPSDFWMDAREVWVYGPSAINFLHDSPDLRRELLDRGGKLRVLIQDPQEHAYIEEVLRQQLDMANNLPRDLRQAVDTLEQLREWGGDRVEYRFSRFSPGFSLLIADPTSQRTGKLIVEFFGFQPELITDRMHIQISPIESQHWYNYWRNQYEAMWSVARVPEYPDMQPSV